jgi:nucleoside-diphosphate-sugar epimerase
MIANANSQQPPRATVPTWLLKGVAFINDSLQLSSELNQETLQSLLLYHWCDSSKAKNELNYQSRPANQAIEASVQWMRENDLL